MSAAWVNGPAVLLCLGLSATLAGLVGRPVPATAPEARAVADSAGPLVDARGQSVPTGPPATRLSMPVRPSAACRWRAG